MHYNEKKVSYGLNEYSSFVSLIHIDNKHVNAYTHCFYQKHSSMFLVGISTIF